MEPIHPATLLDEDGKRHRARPLHLDLGVLGRLQGAGLAVLDADQLEQARLAKVPLRVARIELEIVDVQLGRAAWRGIDHGEL